MAEKTFDVLDLEGNTELLVSGFSNQLPDKNVGRNSDNWKRLRSVALAKTDLDAHVAACFRDSLPDTASEATINRHGDTHGVTRKAASAASEESAGKIRGANGSSWDHTTDTLRHKSGLRFQPTTSGTLGVSGEALVGIIAIDTGPQTRIEAGEVLIWEVTPPGLENEVKLVLDLEDGGEASEQIGAYRGRVLNRIAQPAQGGNANDWAQWVLESAAYVATAYVWPNRNGRGSVDVAGLKAGSASARLLSAPEQATLLAYVNTKRPVAAAARVLDVITQAVNVTVTLVPESGVQFSRDWDDSTPLVVSTWTPGTRILVFTTPRPASMAAGHRLVVAGTSGVELEIESLSSTDAVVIKDALGQTPAGAQQVFSGGPIVTPVRAAILAQFDGLGPRVGDFGQGNWVGSLLLSQLFETIQTTEGVLDSTIVAPVANVEPTPESFPFDAQIRLLIAGNVIVRYA